MGRVTLSRFLRAWRRGWHRGKWEPVLSIEVHGPDDLTADDVHTIMKWLTQSGYGDPERSRL